MTPERVPGPGTPLWRIRDVDGTIVTTDPCQGCGCVNHRHFPSRAEARQFISGASL